MRAAAMVAARYAFRQIVLRKLALRADSYDIALPVSFTNLS